MSHHILMLLSKPVRQDPRVAREAEALLRDGHRVTLVQWARRDPEAPVQEEIDGLRVVRVRNTPLMRAAGHDLFRNPLWWRAALRAGLAVHRTDPVDAVHCHDLDTLTAGVRLKRRLGVPLVYDAHEIFRYMIEGEIPWPVPALADAMERRLLRSVDHLITPIEGLRAYYAVHYSGPITVVWNAFADPPGPYQAPPDGPFTVVYIGTLSSDRMFPEIVEAIGAMDDVRFVVGGKKEGVYDQVQAAAARHPNVTFLGPVPFHEVMPRTRDAHAVLSLLDPANRQYRIAVATKVFDAMLAGRPLVTNEGGEQADFVREEGVGATCAYNPQAVVATIEWLKNDPSLCRNIGQKGLHLAQETYNWPQQAERLCSAYRGLLT